ncbi:phosphoribosylglycinamide synthetase [uncultured Roseovarius sp.]|uniref:phosphoribosylglycinamide synthetase n=1 Tax=uncultured Roseovarius sp. TaxID=293344 RepID=UPI0026112BBE|nr:phosphoribosylglycinamide synthetase [uncultured Roseovarius sp.]
MTFHKFALATALTSITAMAAYADEGEYQSAKDEEPAATVTNGSGMEMTEATISDDGEITAPSSVDLEAKELTNSDKISIENVLTQADDGATLNSVDDAIIGEVVSHAGDRDAQHLVYVDVRDDADLAADKIAFEVGTLSAEESGGLEYAYTMEQLRTAVAAKVATMTQ